MTSMMLKEIVATQVARNLREWQSKFGPKSIDAPIYADSEVTLKDQLAGRTYDVGDDADEAVERSSLLPHELDALDDRSLASEAMWLRERAEQGRGWVSTLDVQI